MTATAICKWSTAVAAISVRSLPLKGGGSGWGSSSAQQLTPTRRFAPTSPLQGRWNPRHVRSTPNDFQLLNLLLEQRWAKRERSR